MNRNVSIWWVVIGTVLILGVCLAVTGCGPRAGLKTEPNVQLSEKYDAWLYHSTLIADNYLGRCEAGYPNACAEGLSLTKRDLDRLLQVARQGECIKWKW